MKRPTTRHGKAKGRGKHSKAPHFRRAVGISQIRAAAIARARVARTWINCEVSADLPTGYAMYPHRTHTKVCWYVSCGLQRTNATGGTRTLLCISKRSGRVLWSTTIPGE